MIIITKILFQIKNDLQYFIDVEINISKPEIENLRNQIKRIDENQEIEIYFILKKYHRNIKRFNNKFKPKTK